MHRFMWHLSYQLVASDCSFPHSCTAISVIGWWPVGCGCFGSRNERIDEKRIEMKGSLLELVLQFPKQQQLKQRATLQPSNIYICIYNSIYLDWKSLGFVYMTYLLETCFLGAFGLYRSEKWMWIATIPIFHLKILFQIIISINLYNTVQCMFIMYFLTFNYWLTIFPSSLRPFFLGSYCWWLKSHSQPPGMVLKPYK